MQHKISKILGKHAKAAGRLEDREIQECADCPLILDHFMMPPIRPVNDHYNSIHYKVKLCSKCTCPKLMGESAAF